MRWSAMLRSIGKHVSDAWTPEKVVDLVLARSLIATQFPELALGAVEAFGVGWDNTAYLVSGEWVFRFPRRSIAAPLVMRETLLLPAVAPRVPVPIPVPRYVGSPSPEYPWAFAGYRLIPGRTASDAALADQARMAL